MKRLLLLFLPLFAHLYGGSDFQIWNTDSIDIHVNNKTILSGQTEFRYGEDHTHLFYKHYQTSLTFIRSAYTLITPGYRQIYHRTPDEWTVEFYPFTDVTFQTKTRMRWFISDRNRIAYRMPEGARSGWLYRNRLEFITPARLFRRGIAPYFSDEIFWEESRGINQNRFILGLRIPYKQKTQLNLYYMLQTIKDSEKHWNNNQVLGIHFFLLF